MFSKRMEELGFQAVGSFLVSKVLRQPVQALPQPVLPGEQGRTGCALAGMLVLD